MAIFPFSLSSVFHQLLHESKKVVVLLTASTNYGFGAAQTKVFSIPAVSPPLLLYFSIILFPTQDGQKDI